MAKVIDTTKAQDVAKLNGSTPHPALSTPIEEYTFPSSGVTVQIAKVSTQRTTDHRNAMRRKDEANGIVPKPPVQVVDIGGEKVKQENVADPDYIEAKQKYEADFNAREFEWFISKTLQFEQKVVDEYRKRSLEEDGTDYSEHPSWYIFLWHIACLNPSEFDAFMSIATSMARPTPAAIADAKERFRGDLSRS